MASVILLVDDEHDLIQVLADALGEVMPGYEVALAHTFDEADAAIRELHGEQRLALVVVDHMLGGRTGLDLLRQLHADKSSVPSILFTGQADEEVAEQAAAVGARVLWKPLRLREWLKEVRSLLT